MADKKRILVTGANGYLARGLIKELLLDNQVEFVLGLDVVFGSDFETAIGYRQPNDARKFQKCEVSVMQPGAIGNLIDFGSINSICHTAWIFNPTHNREKEREVNQQGTCGLLEVASRKHIPHFVYLGSTTAYINPNNSEKLLLESEAVTGTPNYPYSEDKAAVDRVCQAFMKKFQNFTLIRGAIVVGAGTNNIVTKMASLPMMPIVKDYNPLMQFCSEEDMTNVLHLACHKEGRHIVNVTGDEPMRFSAIAKALGRKAVSLPASILYPATELAWKIRLVPFPSGILDLVRYPWLGDNTYLKTVFGYQPKKTTYEALMEYVLR